MRLYLLRKILFLCLSVFVCVAVAAQTHTSVPLESQIYHILEQAEMRGLCSPLSGIRPYTQGVVVSAIREILEPEKADSLRAAEREILEQYLARFSSPNLGIDWQRGAFYGETIIGSDVLVTANAGIGVDIQGSAGFYSSDERYWGTEIWALAYLNGNLGNNFSYGFDFTGGLIRAPRRDLGEYNTYYDGFDMGPDSEYVNKKINVYSEPLTHFPYTYKKRWDGSIFFFDSLSGFRSWPESAAGGYGLLSEITGSFWDNKLIMRAGRMSHDWGSAPIGSSLAFNQMARPFAGIEAEFNPVSWFGIASLTGILEYHNLNGIKNSSETFQNAFSITMLQFRYKSYLFFDFVDAVIWPKRFELGYMLPIINNFFYQNNIGDFDNMAISLNLRAQYPGLGSFWASIFIDEMNFLNDIPTLDRQMFAWQTGLNIPLPVLSFSSVKLSYTKVNPYNYTHNRNFNPWYGDLRMETAYVNNGVSLGYYLPPNSDEVLVKFSSMPVKNLTANAQYQMIRHGADIGPSSVDGSNLLSELDPVDRGSKLVLKRFFLRDGAYQWQHIIRLSGEWTLDKAPLAFYFEAGTVISYFTNIEEEANITGEPHPYSVVDTSDYPKSNGIIMKLGVRVFPR